MVTLWARGREVTFSSLEGSRLSQVIDLLSFFPDDVPFHSEVDAVCLAFAEGREFLEFEQ